MRKIIYSPEYKEKIFRMRSDLDAQYGEQTRKKTLSAIDKSLQQLKTYPRLGISFREMFGIDCDAYYIYVSHNYIFYEIGDKDIRIINMYHEREDFIIKFLGSRSRLHEEADEWTE